MTPKLADCFGQPHSRSDNAQENKRELKQKAKDRQQIY